MDPRGMRFHHFATRLRRRRGPTVIGIALLMVAFFTEITVARAQIDEPTADVLPHAAGEGVALGKGLWLGGYLNISGEVLQSTPASIGLGDMGLLARYEPTPPLAFFSEIDLEDTLTLKEGSGVTRGSKVLLLERLYADWSVSRTTTVRIGKFLTPFGLWNVIRRAPLTWTVDRPVATQSAFAEHSTGLGLIYQTTRHGWTLDATGYGQAQDELVRGASDVSALAVAGGRIVGGRSLGSSYLSVGLSAIGFKNQDTHLWEDAYGSDVELTMCRHQLMGEFAYSHLREPGASREWGFYLQDAWPLYGSLDGVARFEHAATRQGPVLDGGLVGIDWHAVPHVVVKADYQFSSHPQSDLQQGFLASVVFYF